MNFPIFQKDVPRLFGSPSSTEFAKEWIIRIDLAEFGQFFPGVKLWHNKDYFGFEGNKLLEAPFKATLQSLVDKKLNKELLTFDGCWVVRQMKGNANLRSMHSWGLA